MDPYLRLFGPVHLSILAAVPALGAALAWRVRRRPAEARPLRLAFGTALIINELIWYGFRLYHEGFRFPEALPLQLCDLSLWLSAATALTLSQWAGELAYYWGLAGSTMALLTPDLWEAFPSYPTVYFFLAHGGLVALMLFLIWGRLLRPRPGSFWRAFFVLNVYAAAIGIFNLVFHTNYLYLCEKPASASLLDLFGDWPWYLLPAEAAGLAIFALLAWPFRHAPSAVD